MLQSFEERVIASEDDTMFFYNDRNTLQSSNTI